MKRDKKKRGAAKVRKERGEKVHSFEHSKQEAGTLKTAQLFIQRGCFPAYEQSLVYFGVPLISKFFKHCKVL